MATNAVALPPGLQVSRVQGDLQNSDIATAQTVSMMCEQIDRSASDRMVQAAARDAARRFRGGPLNYLMGQSPKAPACLAESVWWWCKYGLRFVHHDGLIEVWFHERNQLQLLISPDLLLRMDRPRGDCAIYTMLECALLKCLGVPYEIVTAAVDPNVPDQYSHVYARAVMPNGRRLVLDASHGSRAGWEVPPEHIIRKQVWDAAGDPVEDVAPRFHGLHAYQARPTRPIMPGRIALVPRVRFGQQSFRAGLGRFRRRGLGDLTTVDASGNIVDAAGNVVGSTADTPVYTSAPGSTGGGGFWSAFPNLLNQGINILGRVVAPTATIESGPGGTRIVTPASAQLPFNPATGGAPFGNIGQSFGAMGFLPIVLIGGVMVFALMASARRS